MKRTVLLLLACLLLALPTVAQAPDDLVVTAEIVGHSFGLSYKQVQNLQTKLELIFYVRLNVHNQTDSTREVAFYSCSWDDAWIQKGPVSFDIWGCDKNYPTTLPIPPRQSIIFYAPIRISGKKGEPVKFSFGFVDFKKIDFELKYNAKSWHKHLQAKNVYWSNELDGSIDPASTPEITGSGQYPRYSLLEAKR